MAHIGPTAVPGVPAADVIELQIDAASPEGLREALLAVGFVEGPPDHGAGRFASSDPGRAADLHVRSSGTAQWREALLRRDWLRADPGARAEFVRVLEESLPVAGDSAAYAAAGDQWWQGETERVERWAASSGWAPSLH